MSNRLILATFIIAVMVQAGAAGKKDRIETAHSRGHGLGIEKLTFSQDGRLLASAGRDNLVKIWSMKTREEVCSFDSMPGERFALSGIADMDISADGTLFAAGVRKTSTVYIVDIGTCSVLKSFSPYKDDLCSVKFHPGGKYIATKGTFRGYIDFWDMATLKKTMSVPLRSIYTNINFDISGKYLILQDIKYTISLYDIEKRKRVHQLPTGDSIPSLSRDGALACFSFASGNLEIWDVWKIRLLHRIEKAHGVNEKKYNKGFCLSMAFGGGNALLGTLGNDGTVRVWDVKTGKQITALRGYDRIDYDIKVLYTADYSRAGDKIYSIALSEDSVLATGNHNSTLKLWNPATGKETFSLTSERLK